ncbi:hypothetical protein VaNZ11_008819 [Volvox africanus]|uniref:GATA-type domain-containing protein n=1 Tax=Volvox africanus TaxID=51714 RepID=A0ABQ5S6B8_9CHLO|nr:hypothetical protein VaNZ11_008819 [Volvox africanus]
MRGNKRRGAVVATAAKQSQPTALNDAILDVVNRKGTRCCVECGATSTPQWREGPMGPKTLCNACGVRRQRLLRKQQAATVGLVPTAPVAAVQARRRIVGRATPQSTPLESEDLPFGAASGSEHSSDETEVDWATGTANKHHHHHHQLHPREQLAAPQEVEESCNEDESAAYDLLFFAGVECGSQHFHQHHDHLDQQLQGHGHNTRRHVQPVRRQDDFFYYSEDEAVGLERGRMDQGGCKRPRITALVAPALQPPPTGLDLRLQQHHVIRPWQRGSSLSSTEDMAESEVAFKLSKASGDVAKMQQQSQPQLAHGEPVQQEIQTHLQSALGQQQQQQQQPGERCQLPPTARADLNEHASGLAPSEELGQPNPLAIPPIGHFSVPMALPVLPLSLPLPALSLPAISTKDLEILVKLQLEFQRACMQLHHANVACEAVGAVVEERRQAAVSAHDQAAVASQQLAAEARAMADRYRLRDVLNRLQADPIARRAVPVAGAQAVPLPEMMMEQLQPELEPRSPAEQH